MNALVRRGASALLSILFIALNCRAQQTKAPSPPVSTSSGAAPQPAGLETPWDVRKILAALAKDNEQLKPMIVRLNPQEWYDQKGAPSAYIVQWTTAERQVNDVAVSLRLLSANTESLSLAVDTYFRLEALETSTRSLDEGAHKYGDRATADKLSEVIAQDFTNREHFRDYIRDLAGSKEQICKIADEEAQRCRGMISKEPPAATKKLKRN
jgi:hypothetical protein